MHLLVHNSAPLHVKCALAVLTLAWSLKKCVFLAFFGFKRSKKGTCRANSGLSTVQACSACKSGPINVKFSRLKSLLCASGSNPRCQNAWKRPKFLNKTRFKSKKWGTCRPNFAHLSTDLEWAHQVPSRQVKFRQVRWPDCARGWGKMGISLFWCKMCTLSANSAQSTARTHF
jgi:hypothetical protein